MNSTPVESLPPQRPSGESINMDFQSIESTCQLWRTAGIIIATYLPLQLEFRIDPIDCSRLELDNDWARTILSIAPPEDTADICGRLARCHLMIGEAMPQSLLESFLQQPSNAATVRALNFAMRSYDDYLAAHGYATLPQILQHAMGIRSARAILKGRKT